MDPYVWEGVEGEEVRVDFLATLNFDGFYPESAGTNEARAVAGDANPDGTLVAAEGTFEVTAAGAASWVEGWLKAKCPE